jgi:hypothetical protein
MAMFYQKMGQNNKAWSWLDFACFLDPAEACDPAVQATLKRLSFPIQHPSGSPTSPDYLAGVFKADRWSKDAMPLKAYIKPNSNLASFHKEFADMVRNAMEQWCNATSGVVSYKLVDKPEGANLLWIYTDSQDDCNAVCEMGLDGATDLKVGVMDDKPELATIAILVKDKPGGLLRDQNIITRSCLHEMGHALGMNGHSPSNHDVMFPSANTDGKATLSERDKCTIRKLYQLGASSK